jgi:Zn-dependent M28 family amino/carboxypeptidase
MKKVKGYLYFDMIGRDCAEGRPNHFTLMHAPKDSVFTAWLNSDIAQYSLALDPQFKTGEDFNNGSDQVPFFKAGIPFVWYQTGGHPDFHMPTDEPSRINWDKMVEITKASFLCLWKMANNP